MSRPPRRYRSSVEDYVADKHLRADLEEAIGMGSKSSLDFAIHLAQQLSDEDPDTQLAFRRLIGSFVSPAWQNPKHRAAAVEFLGQDIDQGRCAGCSRELERNQHGRPRRHCNTACRSRAYRNRKRAEPWQQSHE